MPIAQIIVAPDLASAVTEQADELSRAVTAILTEDMGARPQLVQVMITAALVAPQGCDILCLVHHRGSAARSAALRARAADHLHDLLHDLPNDLPHDLSPGRTGRTVRVRLIAIDPDNIAAKDSPEALS